MPQDWAMTQNNLGIALRNLAERSEGAQASQYLQQAVDDFRSALQVRTESDFPVQWARTRLSLARTYEAQKDRENARKCYEQLLRLYPADQRLQAKVTELSEKR